MKKITDRTLAAIYTFDECLSYLPPDAAEKIRQQPQAHTGVVEFDKPSDIIVYGILWGKTNEGLDYWRQFIK